MNKTSDLIKRNLAIAYAISGLVRRIDGENWIRTSEVKQSLNDVPKVEAYTSEDLVKYISNTEDLVREKLERTKGGLTEAEKIICKMYLEDLDKTHTCNEYKLLMNLIDNAPAVEERPQNKWVKIFENPFTNGYVCPFCGHKIQVTEKFLPEVTECESCGADMR